jgi:hypothetical protein
LGRAGLRAVSTADLEGGTACRLATPLLGLASTDVVYEGPERA